MINQFQTIANHLPEILDRITSAKFANKDFDVAILVAPGVNGEKTKEEFLEWFNQQEHHNFTVEFTDEATLKNYNVTTNMPTPIYIDSNGNLNQTSKGRNARATNDSIKAYMAEYVK